MSARTLLLTVVTLFAFASNSVLCRLALREGQIDAASFTFLRIGSGAVFLFFAVFLPAFVRKAMRTRTDGRQPKLPLGSPAMGLFLYAYALCFSFAYLSLSAATGGLILFGCVQATMIVYGIVRGERPSAIEWLGIVVAIAGLVYLFLPKLDAPSLVGGSLMALAGVSWGFYSVLGRRVPDPSLATAGNFCIALALTAVSLAMVLPHGHATGRGVALAMVSGAVTSGLGYVVWYHALRGLTATRAAVVQLAVPVIVALGGVAFIGEPLTLSLVVSGALILGGIAIVVAGKARAPLTPVPFPPEGRGGSS